MKNIEEINSLIVKKILAKKKIPEFFAGDTIKVGVRILEGKRERVQYFEGVCIAKKSRDINSSFTVRKISFGEGVERTFALYSSIIKSIKGPIPQASVMPTGGVNLQNADQWIKNGAVAIGIGSDLSKPAKTGNFDEVAKLAKQYCEIVREARNSI